MKRRSLSVQGLLYGTVLEYADANNVSLASVFQAAVVPWLEERGVKIPEGVEREPREMSAVRRKELLRKQTEGREKKARALAEGGQHFTF